MMLFWKQIKITDTGKDNGWMNKPQDNWIYLTKR